MGGALAVRLFCPFLPITIIIDRLLKQHFTCFPSKGAKKFSIFFLELFV